MVNAKTGQKMNTNLLTKRMKKEIKAMGTSDELPPNTSTVRICTEKSFYTFILLRYKNVILLAKTTNPSSETSYKQLPSIFSGSFFPNQVMRVNITRKLSESATFPSLLFSLSLSLSDLINKRDFDRKAETTS